jgi:hypothetical protein
MTDMGIFNNLFSRSSQQQASQCQNDRNTGKFGVYCCFCGKGIDAGEKDPCYVNVTTAKGNEQLWFCHSACFRTQLFDDPSLRPEYF